MSNVELLLVPHRRTCNCLWKTPWVRRCRFGEVHPQDENELPPFSLPARLSVTCNWLSPDTVLSHMKGGLKISCTGILYSWGGHPTAVSTRPQ